jgi:carboxypeptidase family protein
MSCLVQFFKDQSKALRTALFVVAFLSGVAFGQIDSGQLTGKVYDPNGARVPGAIVQAKSEETGLERLATTTDEGFFIFTNLPLTRHAAPPRMPKSLGVNALEMGDSPNTNPSPPSALARSLSD